MPRKRQLDVDKLHLTRGSEYGKTFETGKPVTFTFLRNTEKSPNLGAKYGQDIEPAGKYLLHNPDAESWTKGPGGNRWETGKVTFEKPLVLALTDDENAIYGPTGWKAKLVAASGGLKGKRLSCFLRQHGYDGIVTTDKTNYTREIVDLRVVSCPLPKRR